MLKTHELENFISCLHYNFQAVRKCVKNMVDILARVLCIHGVLNCQIYFSGRCLAMSMAVLGDMLFGLVSMKLAVFDRLLSVGAGPHHPGSEFSFVLGV